MSTIEGSELIASTPFPAAETTECPFAYYAALRAEDPVHRLPTGEFVISNHEDIASVTRRPEIFSSHHSVFVDGWMRAATLDDHRSTAYAWGIVTSDPPQHTVKRKLAFEMFKPGQLRERAPMIEHYTDELIDRFISRGECEFVSEFAERLPATVILALFGLPLDYTDRAIAWGRYEGFGTRFAALGSQRAAREAIMDLGGFLRDRILERVDEPGDDDLSRHIRRHIEHHGTLDLPNLIAEASNLFIGGIVTTTHLISSMMLLFINHPEEQRKARTGGTALLRAIEEALRVESPIQMGPRLVTQDTEIRGTRIPAGSIVLLVWGSANRDETVFERPERFDTARGNLKDHMAFGHGLHFCLGAPLGRLEARIAFERIFARMDNLRFQPSRNDFRNHDAVIFRGPRELFIEFDALPQGNHGETS